MIYIENIETGTVHEGQDIEYFLDDDTMIGEVYIDGNLIYQSVDVTTESQLQLEFRKEYILEETTEVPEIEAGFLDQCIFITKGIVMETTKLFTNMKTLWESFEENHSTFTDKGNKAAATRARKAIGELKKLVTGYRKESVIESKRS